MRVLSALCIYCQNIHDLSLPSDGQKMSKRKKNYPDPTNIVNSYGADALRSESLVFLPFLQCSGVYHSRMLRFATRLGLFMCYS